MFDTLDVRVPPVMLRVVLLPFIAIAGDLLEITVVPFNVAFAPLVRCNAGLLTYTESHSIVTELLADKPWLTITAAVDPPLVFLIVTFGLLPP